MINQNNSYIEVQCLDRANLRLAYPACPLEDICNSSFALILHNCNNMGNECPECETPVAQCKMRDVLRQQPRNRNDLDLSTIKKGEYKRKPNMQDFEDSDQSQIPEILVVQSHIVSKGSKKRQPSSIHHKSDLDKSLFEPIKKPLSLNAEAQNIPLKNGLKYIGSAIDGQPHEKGKVIWQDGTVVLANFFLGHLAQNETISLKTTDDVTYEGEVFQGKANSKGKLILPDGSSYEGQWKNDLPHGHGKHKMSDSSFYQGNFHNGLKSGKGKYYFDHGMYEGEFQNDQFCGEGIMITNDGRTIKGTWKNGELQGKGSIDWASGEKYEGSFIRSCREGEGTYWFGDGRKWTGEWSNDQQNGFGSYMLPNGQIIKGVWVKGVKKDEMRDMDASRGKILIL